jgi:hypothetical protein
MQNAWEIYGIHTKFWSENLKGRYYLEVLGVDGRIILEWILEKWEWRCGLASYRSGQGPQTCSCKHGNEPSSCIKGGEFLD